MILYLVIKTSGVLHFDYEGEQKRNKIDKNETMNMKKKAIPWVYFAFCAN